MKTTIYELLGMINNDIFIKRILFKNQVYEYKEDAKDYYNEEYGWIFDEYDLISILKDSFNYLQKLAEDEIPDKIEKLDLSNGISVVHCAYKINEIIEVLNENSRLNNQNSK